MHNVAPQRESDLDYIATLRTQLQEMGEGFIESLPSLAIALFIVLITWIVAPACAGSSRSRCGRDAMESHLWTRMLSGYHQYSNVFWVAERVQRKK